MRMTLHQGHVFSAIAMSCLGRRLIGVIGSCNINVLIYVLSAQTGRFSLSASPPVYQALCTALLACS
eukprot:3870448-Pleurochrysis_carterae.AAC.1